MSLSVGDIGIGEIRAWIVQRFPDAEYQYLGENVNGVHRFFIDVGPGLRLACTQQTLEHEALLRERLADLDRMGYLADLEKELWLQLTAVGVVVKDSSSW
jgi:hypothetical protein